MPAAQTTQLQTSLLPSLAGQCRHALTVSVETQVLRAPGPTSNFWSGEKRNEGGRFVSSTSLGESASPGEVVGCRFIFLSHSESLLRMPNGDQSMPRLSSWNTVARAKA